MVVIRLTRTGKIHSPHYRIVVQEKRSKLNGKAIDTIGHYHPAEASKQLVVDQEKAKAWVAKGAQTSDTVTNLFVKAGVFKEDRKIKKFYTPKPKEEKVEAPVAVEVAAEEVAPEEAPTEEATTEVVEEAPEATEVVAEEPAVEAETPAEEA